MPSFPLGSSQAVSHPNPSSYAPLADETNHDHKSMNSASNGTIVYAKRLPSSSSTRSGGSAGSSSDTHQANPFRSESEETLSVPNGRDRKGKGREILRVDVNGFDDGDLGNVRAIPRQNGAGRDLEQGRTEDVYESYPPLNEEEEEERRIQANLARLAAQDQARRRARTSRIMHSPRPSTSTSTTSSFMRRPFSIISSISGRDTGQQLPSVQPQPRNSLVGLMDGIRPDAKVTHDGWLNGGAPISDSPNTPSASRVPDNPFTNPYDRQPPMSPSSAVSPPPPATPKSAIQPPQPPMSPESEAVGYDYAGPSWRGGAAARQSTESVSVVEPKRLPEKWWQALCSWGADLDGGHEGDDRDQAGRTNPFE